MMRLLRFTWLELKAFSADFKYFLLLPLLPILVLLSLNPLLRFALEESASSSAFSIAVVDQSGSSTVRMAVTSISQSASLGQNVGVLQVTKSEAEDLILENEIAAAIVIPKDFVEKVERGDPEPIEILLNAQQPVQTMLLEKAITDASKMMGDVQNTLYMISKYTDTMDSINSGDIFQSSMLTLIMDALARDKLYQRISLSPYGETDPILYYGVAVLLIFLCFSSLYQLYKQTEPQRNALMHRKQLASAPSLLFSVSESLAMGILLFIQSIVPCICLLALTENMSHAIFSVFIVLFFVCLGIGCFICLVQMCTRKTSTALLLSITLYVVGILFSGMIVPSAFLGGGVSGSVRNLMIPKYWGQALLSTIDGILPLTEFLPVILFPILCILLIGMRRRQDPHR